MAPPELTVAERPPMIWCNHCCRVGDIKCDYQLTRNNNQPCTQCIKNTENIAKTDPELARARRCVPAENGAWPTDHNRGRAENALRSAAGDGPIRGNVGRLFTAQGPAQPPPRQQQQQRRYAQPRYHYNQHPQGQHTFGPSNPPPPPPQHFDFYGQQATAAEEDRRRAEQQRWEEERREVREERRRLDDERRRLDEERRFAAPRSEYGRPYQPSYYTPNNAQPPHTPAAQPQEPMMMTQQQIDEVVAKALANQQTSTRTESKLGKRKEAPVDELAPAAARRPSVSRGHSPQPRALLFNPSSWQQSSAAPEQSSQPESNRARKRRRRNEDQAAPVRRDITTSGVRFNDPMHVDSDTRLTRTQTNACRGSEHDRAAVGAQTSRSILLENDRRLSAEETRAHSTSYLANPLRSESGLGQRAQQQPVRNANNKREREEYADDETQSVSARRPLFSRGRTDNPRGTSSLHESSIVRGQRRGANQDPRLSQTPAAQDSREREDSRPDTKNDACDSDAKFNFDPDEFNPGAKR